MWSIRVRLQVERRARNLALFNLAIDSKLRGCDLVRLQVDDVSVGGRVRDRATIVQKKTGRPVQFEITEQTRAAIQAWLADIRNRNTRYPFPAEFERSRTCRPGSMPGSSILGSRGLGLIARPMARIRCDGPRRHKYIRKRAP